MTKQESAALNHALSLLAELCLDNHRKLLALTHEDADGFQAQEKARSLLQTLQELEKALSGRP